MKKESILKLLPLINSKPSGAPRTGWVVASCPFAPAKHSDGVDKHPSFAVSIGASSVYNCFSCNSRGPLDGLVFDLKMALGKGKHDGYELGQALQLISNEEQETELDIPDFDQKPKVGSEVKFFPEDWINSFQPFSCFPAARAYLAKRNVPEWVGMELDLRYDSLYQRLCFPIRDWKGYAVGLHGRNIAEDAPYPYYAYKYNDHWNKLPWLGEFWVNPDETVILVESVFDLARVYSVTQNVMCGLSSGLSDEKIERLKKLHEVVLFYDYGTGGDSARKKLRRILKGAVIGEVSPTKEEGDPGSMTDQRIKEVLSPFLSLDAMKVP